MGVQPTFCFHILAPGAGRAHENKRSRERLEWRGLVWATTSCHGDHDATLHDSSIVAEAVQNSVYE